MVRLSRNEKQTYWLNSRAQMWPSGLTLAMTLTLNFQGQIWNLLYLSQKRSDCHKTKKQTYWLNSKASNVTIRFDLGHDLDLCILKVKRDLDLWPHTWPWPWIFMVKFWNSCISGWVGRLTLHKGGGSRSFMTMTMTIWWPRSGAWIYQIVTGVTSVVGVPSTHLVFSSNINGWSDWCEAKRKCIGWILGIIYKYKTECLGCHCDLQQHMSCFSQVFVYGFFKVRYKRAWCFYIVGALLFCDNMQTHLGASVR